MDNKLMENIFAANNKQHLIEGDLFIGSNGKAIREKDVEDRGDFSVPDFVKESFGYDEDGNDTAHTETEDDVEKEVDNDLTETDTCPECGKSGDECTCETVEAVEPPEAGPSFNIDTSDDGWLDLNTLKDDDVFAKVIDLISVNFNHEAAVEGGTDMGFSVIQVKGVTDKKEIKDIIDLIQGTLNSGSYYLNNYRLNDGNLELKIEY